MEFLDISALRSASTARTYPRGVEDLTRAIWEAVESLPRWTLASPAEGEIRAVRQTHLFGFEDDVTVRLAPSSSGRGITNTRAEFRSASRVGVWDWGQNRRNLKELLAAINQELMVA